MAINRIIAILFVALVIPQSVYPQGSPQRVAISYSSRSIASIDLFVAQERGFFREEGLDPQLVQVRATAAIAAIVSGEVSDKSLRDQRDLVKRILRARAKDNRYFQMEERGSSEVLAKYLNVDFQTALETYRLSRGAFTTNGIRTEDEINEYLKADAQILGFPAPVPPSRVFDFSLQRELNRELGVK
jgi:ABC-type nitrate/sulfonate/bicarbonate transport system substrate-binding protein